MSLDLAQEDELVPLSALQHFLFCPRQCALIHLEQLWLEDGATAEGRILHERVDSGRSDRRAGVRTVRGLLIRSLNLGVVGKADAVEFHGTGKTAMPYPIEYKRGRPKRHRADEVQLCAQALCLEEMLDVPVPEGALFYGQTRRRMMVAFDDTLRSLTRQVADDTRRMIVGGVTPAPKFTRACKRCSLETLCAPQRLETPPAIGEWLTGQINAALIDP